MGEGAGLLPESEDTAMPLVEIKVPRIEWSPPGDRGVALSLPSFSVEVEYTIDPTQNALVVGEKGLKVLDRSRLTVPSQKVIVIENRRLPVVATEGAARIRRWNYILTGLGAEAVVLLMRCYEPLVPPRRGWARPMFGFRARARITGQAKCVEDLESYTKVTPHRLGWKPGQQCETSSGPMAVEGPLCPLMIVEKSEGTSIKVPQGAVYRTWREIGAATVKV